MIMHVPVATNVTVPPLVTVQTAFVADVNATASPELAVAVRVGLELKLCAPGLAKVIVCVPCGATEFDAAEAGLVPALLVAVTVKVYAVPFVRPVTVIGEPEPVAVYPPGDEVTV